MSQRVPQLCYFCQATPRQDTQVSSLLGRKEMLASLSESRRKSFKLLCQPNWGCGKKLYNAEISLPLAGLLLVQSEPLEVTWISTNLSHLSFRTFTLFCLRADAFILSADLNSRKFNFKNNITIYCKGISLNIIKWKFWNDSHKLKWNNIMCSLFTVIFNRPCNVNAVKHSGDADYINVKFPDCLIVNCFNSLGLLYGNGFLFQKLGTHYYTTQRR